MTKPQSAASNRANKKEISRGQISYGSLLALRRLLDSPCFAESIPLAKHTSLPVLYSALRRFVSAGWISRELIRPAVGPSKYRYKLTELGRSEAKDILDKLK